MQPFVDILPTTAFLPQWQSLNSCSRKLMAGEAKNIYYLAFYEKKKNKHLLTPGEKDKVQTPFET